MKRMTTIIAVAILASAVLAAVALAGGHGAGSTAPFAGGGFSPGYPGNAVSTAPPAATTPEPPLPSVPSGAASHPVPPDVASKYEPSWGMLGCVKSIQGLTQGSTRSGVAACLGSMLVVGDRAVSVTDIDQAWVTVQPATRVVALHDGVLVAAGCDALHTGSIVAVTFSGPVAESYPVQAVAARIVILD
jgi:hypothetical protein